MGRVFKKISLESHRDLKKATRSIIASCKDLSRGRKVKKILSKLNKENEPMVINTLIHNNLTIVESLLGNIDNNTSNFKEECNSLIELINYSFNHPRENYYKTIPKKRIVQLLKRHSKIFSKTKITKEAINNDEWRKTYLTAIVIWGNNSFR